MDLVALGLVVGMANALLAAGLVLIYMSNRVINFAHGELGAFAVAMMLALTRNAHLNYWLALLLSLAATAALGGIIEKTFLSRLFKSPRLIVLIATIGIAQLVIVGRLVMPKADAVGGSHALAGGANIFPVPFHWAPVEFGRVVLLPQHFMALIAGPIVALGLFAFLRWSAYGVALRAAAENGARARLLGIPVRRVSTLAWIVAALLSGIASILLAPVIGFSATEAVGLPILMRGLAAATVARMESVGLAFGAGLALGVLDQLVFFYTGRSGLTDIVLLAVIVGTLLYRGEANRRTVAAEESSWEVADPVRPLPTEVANHPRWRALTGTLATVGIVAVLFVPRFMTVSGTHFLATVLLVAVVAVSLTVLTGWAGQMSIGQWALAGVGGVLGAKIVTGWGVPFWGGLVAAALLGGLVALILGFPALRLGGTALAVVTLGFAVASASWLFNQEWFKGTGFLPRPAYLTTTVYYYVALAFLVLAVATTRALQKGRVGRNMIAVRDNPRQAAAMGLDIVRTKLTAFVISGVFAGAAGFLWASGVGLASSTVFPPSRSLSLVAAVVIGGLGSVGGAVLGAFYLLVIPYLGTQISPHLGLISSGVGLLILVMFLPGGLARLVGSGRDLAARLLTGQQARTPVVPVSAESPAP
ncbi:MAG TPA: ABC transporter permease [Acidimicrobiales bacterium]|nr:ABC transporter permease [Acidimicrobiales bacterium]